MQLYSVIQMLVIINGPEEIERTMVQIFAPYRTVNQIKDNTGQNFCLILSYLNGNSYYRTICTMVQTLNVQFPCD